MKDYFDFFSCSSEYFIELDKICKEKNWNDITIETLRKWLSSILTYYNPNDNILEHLSVHEYINNSLEKLKQINDVKVLGLEQVLSNPNHYFFESIKKIPFNDDMFKIRLSKIDEHFILDENGDYYLSVQGLCHNMDKTIELLAVEGRDNTFHHELQHINQCYVYPSEFPFANDMLKMLYEGEAEYHRYLINKGSKFLPIEKSSIYYIYYLVYTLLMLVIPKEMKECWNSTYRYNPDIVSDIFKYISDSEVNKKRFSQLFALITLIVAYCNPQNTEEIINASVDTSLNRFLDAVGTLDQSIQSEIEKDRKDSLEKMQQKIEFVEERVHILQNPNLLYEKYLENVSYMKEYIAGKPKERQEELLLELELFTFEKFKSILIEEMEKGKESIHEYQNKGELSQYQILGDKYYRKYQYCQFGIEMNKKMKLLLSQGLTFKDLFRQLLESTICLIDPNETNSTEKFSFIDKIIQNNLLNNKQI